MMLAKNTMKVSARFRLNATIAAATAAVVLSPLGAQAANKAFSTTPADGTFSGINFTVGTAAATPPTSAFVSLDALYLGTSTITTLNNDLTGATVAGITFNAGAPAFTIGGNAFTLSAAITNNSTSLQTINNALTLTANTAIAGTGAVTLGGTVGGAFALNKTTNGTLTLNAANSTFSGGTTIGSSNGATVVRANATQALGTGTIGILGNTTTNRLEVANNISLSNNFTLSGRLAANTGATILNVSGDNTLSGLIGLTTGGNFYNFQSDAGNLNFTNTGTVTFQDANRFLTFSGAGNGSFATAIAGSGSLQKTGTGTWTLTGNATFLGSTTVTGGTLNANGGIGAGALTVGNTTTGTGSVGNAVVLNLPTSKTTTVGALSGTVAVPATGTNTATINNGGQLLTVNQNAVVSTFAGAIAGAGGLTVNGTGTGSLTLNGTSTYTGATTITGGSVQVGGSIAASSGVSVTNGTFGTVSGAINNTSVASLSLSGTTGLSFDVGNGTADKLTVGGVVAQSGTTAINVASLGNLSAGSYTLISAAGGLGTASYTLGTTPAIFGTFSLAGSTATAEVLTVNANAAAAVEYWTGKASTTLGDTAPYKWSAGSNVGTVSNWSTDAAGTVDALQVPLSNTLAVFTATNATPTTGTTLATQILQPYSVRGLSFDTSTNASGINAVTVDTNGQALTTGSAGLTLAAANTSDVTINGTGSVVVNGAQSWANNSAKLLTVGTPVAGNAAPSTSNTLSFAGSGAGNTVLSGIVSDGTAGGTLAVAVNKPGAGILVLGGVNTYTGGTTITAGTAQITQTAGAAANGTVNLGAGTFQINTAVSNFNYTPTINLTAAGANFSSIGAGQINFAGTLAGNNNALNVSSGTSRLYINATTTGVTQFNVLAGAMGFDLSAGNRGGGAPVFVTSGASLYLANATNTLDNNITLSGVGQASLGALFNEGNASPIINGAITLAGDTTIGGNGTGQVTINGVISGAAALTKIGVEKYNLAGANTYTGTTTITTGTLQLGAGGTTGSLATSSNIVDNGLLLIARTNAVTQGVDFSGAPITGTGGLTQGGSGTLTLNGANTFSGNVSVAANGTLSVSSINSVVGGTASSNLGAPTTAALGQINLSGSGGSGTLVYTGAGETTDRALNLAGGTVGANNIFVDQSGTGLLRFTSNVLATGGLAHTLTLRGSTAGTGQIDGTIVDNTAVTNITSLTKSGTSTWTVTGANTYTGNTVITAGTLRATTPAYTSGAVYSGTAGTDIQGGRLVLDYTGGATPLAAVKATLTTGYAEPTPFATGLLRSTNATSAIGLGYADNGTAVTVMRTYYGDANLDGQVDFNDFIALQTNYLSPDTNWDQGNFNYDNVTDFNDFIAIQTNYGQSINGANVSFTSEQVGIMNAFFAANTTEVPEPASLAVLGLGATALLRRRRA